MHFVEGLNFKIFFKIGNLPLRGSVDIQFYSNISTIGPFEGSI